MLENWTGVVARRLLAKHIYSVLFKKTEANRSLSATNAGSELSRENAGFILYIVAARSNRNTISSAGILQL